MLLAVGWLPMILMSASILRSYRDRAISVRSTEVQNQCKILSNQLLSYNYMEDPSTELIDGELAQLASLYDGRIIIIDQNFRVIKDTYGLIENKYVVSEEVIRCFKGETTNQLSEKRFIEMTVPVRAGDSNKVQGVLLVSVSTDSIWDNLEALTSNTWIFTLVYGILVTMAAILLSILLVRPIQRIILELHEISSGHSNEDLMVKTYAETEEISEEFNKIVTQMRTLDESRQEFVSNVSHELKTPLTSMKVLADSLLTQEEVPNELYKEFMGDSAGETDRRSRQGRRAGRQTPVPLFACRRFETGYLVGNLQSPPEMQKPCASSIHKVFARLPSFAGLYERETGVEPATLSLGS